MAARDGEELTVVLNDPMARRLLARQRWLRVLPRRSWGELPGKGVFVFSVASSIDAVANVVRNANNGNRLRVFLVRSDVDPRALPQLLEQANIRTLRNMLVHNDQSVPRRVIEAWRSGAQVELIAQAYIVGTDLLVISCALEKYRIPIADIPPLRDLREDEVAALEIDQDGSHIHWPAADVHLDLSSIRYVSDDQYRKRQDLEALLADERFGKTIARMRSESGLRQVEIPGLSSRQLRRIETGGRASLRALSALARAFGLSLDAFLARVAEATAEG
jgi:hypothetical protein